MFRKRSEPPQTIEWLIIGLGNPGAEYRGTRHNVGFEVIDVLAHHHGIKMGKQLQKALTGTGTVSGVPVCLAKPLTYMNLSGQSVGPLMRKFGLKPDRVLVIADDVDLAVGRLRLRTEGRSGGHNGHKSVMEALRTHEYPRIKIGVGKSGETIHHVLSGFPPSERTTIDAAIRHAADGVEKLLIAGVQPAQEFLASFNRSMDE